VTDQTQPNDDLLTIAEVSAILRTPVATLRYWRHLGIGPHSFKIGRRVFYRAGDVYTWLEAQHDKHGPTAA
jgi:DNA-binding transcriptional MerR regulator